MTDANGFTFLELIIVLTIAAILAGISVLSHQALRPGLDLNAAARQVAMDLKVMRIRAVSDHVNHRLVFTEETDSYQPQRRNGSSYRNDGAPLSLPHGIVVATCAANDRAIGFGPRGNATSFGTVTLRNSKNDVRQVIVDIAGQVRVQ